MAKDNGEWFYLHVSTTPATFTIEALADGVHRDQDQLLSLFAQLNCNPLEGVERLASDVDVVLIHLQSGLPMRCPLHNLPRAHLQME